MFSLRKLDKDFGIDETSTDKYAASEQGLGYIYQARLALLNLLQLSEDTTVLIERDDDLDFPDAGGGKSLASIKHKAIGDKLTDLSIDFWKSVNIWMVRYKQDSYVGSNLRFFLFTTSMVSTDSFLRRLLSHQTIAPNKGKSDFRWLSADDIPLIIKDKHMRPVRREHRDFVFERL